MMFRFDAVTESVRDTPCQSASTNRKTVTTRHTTNTVMPVDTFLTNRFRRLYFSGIAMLLPSHHLPQSIHDLHLRGADRRDEAGEDAHPDGDPERRRQDGPRDLEIEHEGRHRRRLHPLDHARDEEVLGEDDAEHAAEERHQDGL